MTDPIYPSIIIAGIIVFVVWTILALINDNRRKR
jgi:hypothetical protein